jgi:hypothetical protein
MGPLRVRERSRPTIAPVRGQQFGAFADRVWYAIPLFLDFGVNQTLLTEFANWAKTVWPLGAWDQTLVATCTHRYRAATLPVARNSNVGAKADCDDDNG